VLAEDAYAPKAQAGGPPGVRCMLVAGLCEPYRSLPAGTLRRWPIERGVVPSPYRSVNRDRSGALVAWAAATG